MLSLDLRMELDTKNYITSLDSLGMTDPLSQRKTLNCAISTVKTFDFLTEIYPSAIMK
jgi:hypothetical protein